MSTPNIPNFQEIAEEIQSRLRRYAKVYCLSFFVDTFQKQGFTDTSFQPWEARKDPDRRPGGAILVQTAFLRNSLQVLSEDENTIHFGTHTPYASVHNNGERLRTIQNVRGYHRTRKGKREQVKPHFRKQDSQYPKRQFIGHSSYMMGQLNQWLIEDIQQQFKEHLNSN